MSSFWEQLRSLYPTEYEPKLRKLGVGIFAGTDEVGRGCLAGPVVAAAVILPDPCFLQGVKDSKLLTAPLRESLSEKIQESALAYGIAQVEPAEIDQINIFQASLKAMRLAVQKLSILPELLLVDGKYPVPNLALPQYPIVQGDRHCPSISAASILAKVARDRLMVRYEREFPNFSFATHKGYPTPRHRLELQQTGPTAIHRRSFKLVGGE